MISTFLLSCGYLCQYGVQSLGSETTNRENNSDHQYHAKRKKNNMFQEHRPGAADRHQRHVGAAGVAPAQRHLAACQKFFSTRAKIFYRSCSRRWRSASIYDENVP
eukprot:3246389-Amphidinium_carterae.1